MSDIVGLVAAPVIAAICATVIVEAFQRWAR